jgi:ketosteroid isomerase-like protein/ribosomal protein S18 acetylase RimI-like enzyme
LEVTRSDAKQVAQDFLDALKTNTAEQYAKIFTDDVGLMIGRWDKSEIHRPQHRVITRLMSEWSAWPDPRVERLNVFGEGNQVSVEFRIQATESDRYVEHNRSAILRIKEGKIELIRMYCPEPMPSARRKGWIAPANLSDEEMGRVFESMMNGSDPYEWLAPDEAGRWSLRGGMGGSGLPHPGSNFVGGVRWTPEEADRKIEETIEHHRQRNIGFQWWVTPHDTPIDLRARLEKHGMVLAGDAATMAYIGLDHLDIPVNPAVEVELLTGPDEATIEDIGHIMIVSFHWTQEQVNERKPGWLERLADAKLREQEGVYVARLNQQVVGFGRVQFRAGVAYLGGAGTLPEFRGQKVYSTLLRRRMESAHERGYHVAAVNAEPLSRRILAHYGFKEYARSYIYGWMPVIDLDVIKSLVPQ